MKPKKTKYIKVNIEVVVEAVDGNMFDTAENAENAIGDYIHDWLSDATNVVSCDTEAESYEE